jgi:hypothetical protein
LTPHPFACPGHGYCREPITWAQRGRVGGWCDAHLPPWARAVPIRIGPFGSWCEWPMDLRTYAHLWQQGAFDERGRTRPFAEWAAHRPVSADLW